MPRPRAASTWARSTPFDAGDDVARQHELCVGDQRNENRREPEAEELHEHGQQREARNRIDRAERPEQPRRNARAARRKHAQGQRNRERDGQCRGDDLDVSARQRGDAPGGRMRTSTQRIPHVQVVCRYTSSPACTSSRT